MINVGYFAPTSPVPSSRFVFLQPTHYMHQRHWRHSRRLMNADTLDGEASASLNAEASHYLLLAEQLPVRSAFLFSLFHLVFASVTFAVTFVFIHLKYLVAHHI